MRRHVTNQPFPKSLDHEPESTMITTHGCPTCKCEPPASWVRQELAHPWRYPTERYGQRLLPAWSAAVAAMRGSPDGWAVRQSLVGEMVAASDVKPKTCENQLRFAELARFLNVKRGVGGSLWYRLADDPGVSATPSPRSPESDEPPGSAYSPEELATMPEELRRLMQ